MSKNMKIATISIISLVLIIAIILIVMSLCPVVEENVDKKVYYDKTQDLYSIEDFPDAEKITYTLEYPSKSDGSGYTSILTKNFAKIDKYKIIAKCKDAEYKISYGHLLGELQNKKSTTFKNHKLDYEYSEENNISKLIIRYEKYSIDIEYNKIETKEKITDDATLILNDFFEK